MAQIVVPFRGATGKRRLDAPRPGRTSSRWRCSATCSPRATATGRTFVVTDDQAARALAAELGAEPVADPAGGQGAAVAAALERLDEAPCSSSTPTCRASSPHDLRTLAGAAELGAIGYVEAERRDDERARARRRGALRPALRRAAAPPASASTPTASA